MCAMKDYSQYDHLKEGDACPLCGQKLVLRHSNHGDFLGCSDYPSCSFLKPVAVSHSVITLGEVGAPCPSCGAACSAIAVLASMLPATADAPPTTNARLEIPLPIAPPRLLLVMEHDYNHHNAQTR